MKRGTTSFTIPSIYGHRRIRIGSVNIRKTRGYLFLRCTCVCETHAHEVVGLFVGPRDEADDARRTVVEVPREDVGVDEARNGDRHRHDPDDRDLT